MPLFSIIIPTYNSAGTLKSTLDSIVAQRFQDFEVMIMDGVSKDNTLEIAKGYQDSRIRIYSEKDNGVYDAMNKGIEKSNGAWLYFLGSDDVLRDFSVLENVAQQISKDQADFIYGNVWFIQRKYKHIGEVSRLQLMTQHNIGHQAIFYKKALFHRLGNYNPEFKIWADWDFNIRCFSTPDVRVRYIDLLIANYNDADGLSNSVKYDEALYPYLPLDSKRGIIYKIGWWVSLPVRKIREYTGGKKK